MDGLLVEVVVEITQLVLLHLAVMVEVVVVVLDHQMLEWNLEQQILVEVVEALESLIKTELMVVLVS
jgi:hypothetical protein